ncbi:MAG TPA: Uma2 family endonuclease [Rhodothermales bacterium]|nr:Uma2 family endonuclease [Rhodothermales bacterium]
MSTATQTLPEGPLTWQDVLDHPALQDLPFKIELNEWGQIIMSPASNKHGILQAEMAFLLKSKMAKGRVITECSIDTAKGTKVADVAWMSDDFLTNQGAETPYRKAPEICVEIVSPSNTAAEMEEKIVLYLAKGAKEVWLCDLEGHLSFHGNEGQQEVSVLAPNFPTQI